MDCRASNGYHPRPAVRRRPLRQVLPHSSERQAVARHQTTVRGPAQVDFYVNFEPTDRCLPRTRNLAASGPNPVETGMIGPKEASFWGQKA
jgi:hypothetical protein